MKQTRPSLRRRRISAPFLLGLAIFALGFAAGSWARSNSRANDPAEPDAERALAPFREALTLIESRYIDAVARDRLAEGAIKGMVDALDDAHSAYLKPELCLVSRNFSGEFSGIGVTARTDKATRRIQVATVIPNAPAHKVGVKPGDVFHEVNGESVLGMSQAELSALVPGPPGEGVTIVFQRGDAFISFDIIRDTFETPNVAYEIVGGNIALVSMLAFHERSRAQLDEALASIDVNRRTGLIFDLRNNPGGLLSSAMEIGGAFIKEGMLLRQVARDQSEEITHVSGAFADIQVPIVVLVDETSASAAEVVAGAMQDHAVATLIGETTFGKGTVQNLPELSNGACLRLTTRRWLTPKGHWIHERGVAPDIIVEGNLAADEVDRQLIAAIDFLQSRRD